MPRVLTNDFQLAVFKLAREQGIDPENMSPAQNRRLQLEARSFQEKAQALGQLVTSRILTTLKLRVVSNEIAASNAKICQSNRCGAFRWLTDPSTKAQQQACTACGCSGSNLESKQRDSAYSCPRTDVETKQRYWDNRTKPSEAVTLEVPGGDATRGL